MYLYLPSVFHHAALSKVLKLSSLFHHTFKWQHPALHLSMNNILISVICFQPNVTEKEKQLIEFLNVFYEI